MILQGYKVFRLSSRQLCLQCGAETEAVGHSFNLVAHPAWAAWGCGAAIHSQAVCTII